MYQHQNDPQKVTTGEVRLSYCHLITPQQPSTPGKTPTYGVCILIPKSDAQTLQALQAAEQYTAQVNNVQQASLIHDGDGTKPNKGTPYGDECKGHWVLNASSTTKRPVVSPENLNADLPATEIYSGMRGHVCVRFYYSKRNNRIGCGLQSVLKTRDDEPLGGGGNPEDDFSGITMSQYLPQLSGSTTPAVVRPAPQPGYAPPVPQSWYGSQQFAYANPFEVSQSEELPF